LSSSCFLRPFVSFVALLLRAINQTLKCRLTNSSRSSLVAPCATTLPRFMM
jgi:hypothetical protein